jgi:cytochrome c5
MFRNLLSATCFLLNAASIVAATRAAEPPRELAPVKINLPDSDRMFPDGPGADAINNNCLACHSADMVLNQPALSRQAWTAEVHKMINIYKAPIAAEDVDPIVGYLTTLKGTK